jgi:hypothetical protein
LILVLVWANDIPSGPAVFLFILQDLIDFLKIHGKKTNKNYQYSVQLNSTYEKRFHTFRMARRAGKYESQKYPNGVFTNGYQRHFTSDQGVYLFYG